MGPAAGSAGRNGLVPGPGRNGRVSLAWPRLPATAEVAIVAAGYAGYALVRLAVRASRPAAFGPLRSALVLATTAANVVFWT
jgi:hypothetical protein